MKVLILMITLFAAFALGLYIQQSYPLLPGSTMATGSHSAVKSSEAERKPLYWVAPMDANYRRDAPGKSPMGMDLVPVYEEAGGADEPGILISPAVVNNLGVRTAEVQRGSLKTEIATVGYVTLDEERLRHIHSRVEGWVERLSIKSEGERVKAGQTLYELYSPALVNAQEEYLSAARSGLGQLRRASAERLRALGLSKAQIEALAREGKVSQRIETKADEDGFVTELNVREGMFIQPATEVMAIGSLDEVWIIAEVFEGQSSLIQVGQSVDVTVPALPGRSWQGVVDFVYPMLDSTTRTLKVRIRVSNEAQQLKPNMFADISLQRFVSDDALSIPREALIRGSEQDRVVLTDGEGRFTSRAVEAGVEAFDRVQILEGLEAGDQIVTSGQFLIDSETAIDAEMERMAEPAAVTDEKPRRVVTRGEVKSLMTDIGMVEISHEPVPEWQWPAMQMAFMADDSKALETLEPGDRVEFAMEEGEEGDYIISDVIIMESTTP